MDEFGNRLSDEAIKDLFREKPPFLNEELCSLFKLKMSIFDPFLSKESTEVEWDFQEIDRLYQEFFYERDEVEEKRKRLEEYKKDLDPEVVKKIEKECFEKVEAKPKSKKSYRSNNEDEEQLLKLAENFQRQYRFLYPEGPRYFLFLPNEEGTLKIVCTTLCPYLCSRHELRDWQKCAEFVADFLEYVPLESPKLAPNFLASPGYILTSRKGNSLDMSSVLCSLLLSAEYDAYVVHGYGRKDLCEKNERDKPCPLHKLKTIFEKYEGFVEDRRELPPPLNKYQQIEAESNVLEKRSSYMEMLKKREVDGAIALEKEKRENKERLKKQFEVTNDHCYGQRVHFWVLVKPGKRDVSETFFIETTTGEKRKTNDLQYMTIEFVWNNRNFWLNKQRSDQNCDLDFDFDKTKNWDYFLTSESEISDSLTKEGIHWVPMPQSWVDEYKITFDDMQQVLPKKTKETWYSSAKIEKFNPFICPDGCAIKTTFYEDDTYEKPKQVDELLKNRSDRMFLRETNLLENEVEEFFEEGRDDGLKGHKCFMNDQIVTKRIISYYPMIRPDGLIQRTATKEQVFDIFSGRTDFLSSRKVTYRVEEESTCATQNLNQQQDIPAIDIEYPIDQPLTPYSFEGPEPLLDDVNFEKWKFEDLLQYIDPEYRYASDSESDEETVGMVIDIPKGQLSEEEFETEYKLFISSLKDDVAGFKSLYPIYEELTESKGILKSKKKSLKRLVTEKYADASSMGERRKKDRRKLENIEERMKTNINIHDALRKHGGLQLSDWSIEEEVTLNSRKSKEGMKMTIIKRKQLFQNQKVDAGRKLIVDIDDKYERNPSKLIEFDVLRKRYMLDEGRYCIFFHPLPERITFRGIIFNKPVAKSLYHSETFDFTDDLYEEIHPGYVTKPFPKLYLYRELLLLMRSEAEAVKVASQIDINISHFLESRKREETNLKLTASLSDTTMREETKTMKEDEFITKIFQACKERDKLDYLTPALGMVGFKMPLDFERAKTAYEFMIKDLVTTLKRKIYFITERLKKTMFEFYCKQEEAIQQEPHFTVKELSRQVKSFKKLETVVTALRMRSEWMAKLSIEKYHGLKVKMFEDPRLQVFTSTL